MCQGQGAYLLSYSGFLLHPARHCACQDSAAGHALPCPHQHVQLNNVSLLLQHKNLITNKPQISCSTKYAMNAKHKILPFINFMPIKP